MGPPAVVMGVLSVATTAAEMYQNQQAANERNKALDVRMDQERVAAKQKSIQRLDRLKTVTASNVAAAGARGVDPASPSFKAINEHNYNQFDQDENASALNMQYRGNYVNQLEGINDEESYIQAFGDISSLGEDFYSQRINK